VISSRRDVRRRLIPILGGLALIAIILLLPDIGSVVRVDSEDVVEAFRGRIESIEQAPADDTGALPVPMARVTALEGSRAGEVLDAYLTGPGGSQSVAGYQAGDEVVVTIAVSPNGQEPFISVSDRWRLPAVIALVVLFAVAVVVVGGWQGMRALIALGLTVVVIMRIMLPLIVRGVPPVPLAVVTASAVTIVTIILTEGAKRSSIAAILGTTAALALTGLLAAGATAVMGFTYQAGSDLGYLATQGGQGLDLRGVLLASFILGAVGVLDDVTVTQAALVEELGDKGGLNGRALFSSAMGIGRSHIAATVNTLFLAYVGASLPLLVVLVVSAQPAALLFNDEIIVSEIVRTVVGSLGIIAAVPLTTFIATSLVTGARSGADDERSESSRRTLPVILGIVVVLLLLTAALPLTDGARAVLAPGDAFDPNASLPAEAPVVEASAEPSAASSDDPTIVERGEAVPITLDGEPVGTITVMAWTRSPVSSGSDVERLTVDILYTATAPFPLGVGSWALVLDDGGQTPFELATEGATLDRTLAAGDSVTLTFEAELPIASTQPVLVLVDQTSGDFILGIVLD
jgi:uncharacterized membrane protein